MMYSDPIDRLDYCARIPNNVLREPPLSVSKVSLVTITIWRNWREWCVGLGDGHYGISTATRKGKSSRAPSKLKADLEEELDCELASTTVYEGMKRLAEVAGSEAVSVDHHPHPEYRGGVIEFRHTRNSHKTLVWMGRND